MRVSGWGAAARARKANATLREEVRLLEDSPWFDAAWYLRQYPDVAADAKQAAAPALHYLKMGGFEGRNPSPFFDSSFYLATYPDVAEQGINPLLHYVLFGCREQRQTRAEAATPEVAMDATDEQVRIAVVLHAYHLPLLAELGERLAVLPQPFDLFVTTPHDRQTPEIQAFIRQFPRANVVECANRGRDIGPFFELLPTLQEYELCLKVHTKQGVTEVAQQWRELLLSSTLPSSTGVQKLLARFRSDPGVILAGPRRLFLSQLAMRFGNTPWLERLAPDLGVPLDEDWGFFAGSMFWFRPCALAPLAKKVASVEFEPESGACDGELAHALERLIGAAAWPQHERVLLLSEEPAVALHMALWRSGMALGQTKPTQLLAQAVAPTTVGDFNPGADNAIRGWLCDRASAEPCQGSVVIDGIIDVPLVADLFRPDLKARGLHDGYHAFEVYPSSRFIDGKRHRLELSDSEGRLVATTEVCWRPNRDFSDFSGYLAHSLVNPFLSRPFREEDKRCLAVMENIADALAEEAQTMTASPLVSIVMPCFNRVHTIEEAVDSVLSQSYGNWELVLVDDGSTDGTAQWCSKRAEEDARIRFIALGTNHGVSAARNAGLAVAKGAYIAYLDSDNAWDSRYLAAMVGAFARNPQADALYSGFYHYSGTATEPSGVMFGALNQTLMFNNNYVDLNVFCHTRAAYERCGGFDEALPRYVDWELIRRYSRELKLVSVPVVLAHYYLGRAGNTLTANRDYESYLDSVRAVGGSWWSPVCQEKGELARGVSVVIPSYESLDDLADCLESLDSLSVASGQLEVIVVDNHSSAPVVEYLREAVDSGRIKAIFNERNYGFTHAVNQGMEVARPDHDIILLNNDAQVCEGAIEAMQRAALGLSDCGLVVPQQILPGGTDTIKTHVPYADPRQPCDVNLSAHHRNVMAPPLFHDGRVLELTFAPFFCVYIPRETYRKAGPLDAQFGRHYRSDRIYCDLVRHWLRLRIYHVAEACVVHRLQRSTRALSGNSDGEFELMFKKNQWDDQTRRELGFREAVWDL
ncbi:MAG: glycosyltransferase [Alteromonadaceae bacterium]|nr:glycosyltransferase [Alteromonadaceae bacterium]